MNQSMIRLLVVDDQDLVRDSLSLLLGTEPRFKVVGGAANGRQAIEKCEDLQPDVVLMDVRMPEMDGVLATQHIKKRWSHIKVIILTSYQEMNYVLEALSVGAEGYMLKATHLQNVTSGILHVYEGGTLIPPSMAQNLITELQELKTALGDTQALRRRTSFKYGLNERESRILELISEGLSNQNIAEKMFLSEGTVKNYISSIYSKLEVKGRKQAVEKAKNDGML